MFFFFNFYSLPVKNKKKRNMSEIALSTPVKSHHVSLNSLNSSQDESFTSKLDLSGYMTSPATRPVGRDNKAGWYKQHEQHASMCKRMGIECIFCGDSIIAGLSRYTNIWREFFVPLKALNLGIGGDRTQHVLWRAENLSLASSTKFVVLHCGTNNIDRDTPTCIANGILSIAVTFLEKLSSVQVLVTALIQRDLTETFRRDKIKKVNRILKRMCRTKFDNVHFMKQASGWVLDDGLLDESLYHTDHLHLIEAGNRKFSKSIIEALDKLKEDGELEYSSDEEGDEEDLSEEEENVYTYQRQQPERRKRRRTYSGEDGDEGDSYHRHHSRLSKKRSRHSDDYRSSRRSSHSKSSSSRRSSSPQRRRHSDKRDSPVSKYKWKEARERSTHGKKKKAKRERSESPPPKRTGQKAVDNTEPEKKIAKSEEKSGPLSGIAKSININLDVQKRLEARRNKFSGPPLGILNPSSLVMKIRKNQEEVKEQQKQKVKTEAVKTETAEDLTIKKFFSDYTADSDTE